MKSINKDLSVGISKYLIMWKVTEILMEELKRLDKVEEERDLSVVENVQKTQVIADVESFFLKEKYLKDKNREHYS